MIEEWIGELKGAADTLPPPVSALSVSPPQPEGPATDRAGGLGFPPCKSGFSLDKLYDLIYFCYIVYFRAIKGGGHGPSRTFQKR